MPRFKNTQSRLLASSSNGNKSYLNVYGNALEPCSQNNMALTGYTRSGSCVEYQDDRGSHHICIDVSSTSGGNFCTVTGQSNWCSSSMACDTNDYGNNDDADAEDSNNQNYSNGNGKCQVQNWCVCQWAFASYLEEAGGCDYIQDIQCDAVNLEALLAYSKMSGSSKDYNKKYTNALNCIESRCNVSSEDWSSFQTQSQNFSRVGRMNDGFAVVSLVAVAVVCVIAIVKSKKMVSVAASTNYHLYSLHCFFFFRCWSLTGLPFRFFQKFHKDDSYSNLDWHDMDHSYLLSVLMQ